MFSYRWICGLRSALHKMLSGSDLFLAISCKCFTKSASILKMLIHLLYFPSINIPSLFHSSLIYQFHMICSRLDPSFHCGAVGFKSFGANLCFFASTKEGDYKVIQVLLHKLNLLYLFSLHLPLSFFLWALPFLNAIFSTCFFFFFPLYILLPALFLPFPYCCLAHSTQDQLCSFPCCWPEPYSLAFRDQESYISCFHHTCCPSLRTKVMNLLEALGAVLSLCCGFGFLGMQGERCGSALALPRLNIDGMCSFGWAPVCRMNSLCEQVLRSFYM